MRACAAVLVAGAAVSTSAAPASVRLAVDDLRMTHTGKLRVALQSTDGRGHRIELRLAHDLGGLRPLPAIVDLPALGVVHAALRVFRGAAAWGTRHEVDLVALEDETPVGLGSATIDVAADPALAPRLRPVLVALGLLLLALAVVTEWRRETAA